MKFVLLIYLRLLIIANSFLLNIAEHENFFSYKYENAKFSGFFFVFFFSYLLAEKFSFWAELNMKIGL